MKRRILAMLMSLVLMIGILPVTALAVDVIDSGKCGENLTWTLTDDYTLTISGKGEMDYYDMYATPWYDIGWQCQKFVIGKDVTGLSEVAFFGLSNLEAFVVDKDNPTFFADEDGVLYSKDKTVIIKVPAQISGRYEIASGVKAISIMSFAECSVSKVVVPASVDFIEENAFFECNYINEFIVDEDNPNFSSENGLLYSKDKADLICVPRYVEDVIEIPASVNRVFSTAFGDGFETYFVKFTGDLPRGIIAIDEWTNMIAYYPEGNPTWTAEAMESLGPTVGWVPYDASNPDAPLPDLSGECGDDLIWTLTKDGTLTISGTGATWDYDILPGYIHSMIESIVFEEGVTRIGDSAFSNLYGVKSIVIPSTVSEIGNQAFWDIGNLEAFEVDKDNQYFTSDEYGVLYNKNKTVLIQAPCWTESEYVIPDGVKTIKEHAFMGNNELIRIYIPASVSEIEPWAFFMSGSLREIVVDKGNAHYCSDKQGVLYNKDMSELVSIPWGRGINYTVPASVKYICERSIPDNINLKFEGDAPEIYDYTIEWLDGTIYYPEDNETWTEEYMQANGGEAVAWVGYAPENADFDVSGTCGDDLTWTLNFDGELTIFGKGDMWNFDQNETDDPFFPNYEDDPEWRAYSNQITSIIIGKDVTSIGDHAFADLNYYTNVTIPGNVKEIGEGAFSYCFGLMDVTIEEGVEVIGSHAFWNNFYIESVNVPASVTEIGVYAFSFSGISEIIIDEDNQHFSVDENSILYNKDMTKLYFVPANISGHYAIPESVTVVEEGTFESNELTSITIPASVVELDVFGLRSCYEMEKIIVDENNPNFSSAEGVLFNKDMSELLVVPSTFKSYTVPASVNYVAETAFYGDSIEVMFTGDAPGFEEGTLEWRMMTIYYPANNATWNDVISKDYEGAEITWIPYTPSTRPQGDVDGDGKISNTDLIMVARYIVELYDAETVNDIKQYGDMDGDGKITNADLISIARIIVGL